MSCTESCQYGWFPPNSCTGKEDTYLQRLYRSVPCLCLCRALLLVTIIALHNFKKARSSNPRSNNTIGLRLNARLYSSGSCSQFRARSIPKLPGFGAAVHVATDLQPRHHATTPAGVINLRICQATSERLTSS